MKVNVEQIIRMDELLLKTKFYTHLIDLLLGEEPDPGQKFGFRARVAQFLHKQEGEIHHALLSFYETNHAHPFWENRAAAAISLTGCNVEVLHTKINDVRKS